MGQVIVKGLQYLSQIIEGKKFLLVKDGAYDFLNVKPFFEHYSHVEFSGFTPNPLYEQVCDGVELFNKEKCELIVAIGGGSTIDVAKCIKLFSKMNSNINYLKQSMFDSGVTLVAVPTTAGTGSESTCHAVIYYEGMKQSISHRSIIPDYAILEPSLLKSLPNYQKRCTMLDALCQAIESWWSVNSTDESKKYSEKAIRTIMENWEDYIFKNTDAAASNIMEAANYAGRAINITATTAAHAMSYKVTSLYNFPHGHAVAVCMPEVWAYMQENTANCIDDRGCEYLNQTLMQIARMISLEQFKGILAELDMKYPVAKNKDTEIEALVESVNPIRLKNNPVALSTEVLREMYRRIVR